MAHNLEILENGLASMAYAGQTPWHGLGKEVPADLTAEQMLYAANLDWTVNKFEVYADVNGVKVPTGQDALIRDRDNKVLDIVGPDWKPVQNSEAFDFFHDFIEAGDMEMHTAGSIDGGKIVWAMAKVKDDFTIHGRDKVESHLLFTNPHSYGKSIDIRFTPTRVVCQNTLSMALGGKNDLQVKLNHRSRFDANLVKSTLGVAHNKMAAYKETAEFLSSKRYNDEQVEEFINGLFDADKDGSMSRTGSTVKALINTQPGAEYGEGSFWQLFNAVTFAVDHVLGRSQETRLKSAWYGPNRVRKDNALKLALDMAKVA